MAVVSSSHVLDEVPQSAAAGDSPSRVAVRRRRLPSPQEQARRKAWGQKWGQLVSDATKGMREPK